jgi:hypothetical protein
MKKLFCLTIIASLAATPAFAEAASGKDFESALTMLIVMAAFYALPSIVAWRRGHHQTLAILTLNIGLGWTLIGWIGALVWANTAIKRRNPDGTLA